jgi:hypothetical protein
MGSALCGVWVVLDDQFPWGDFSPTATVTSKTSNQHHQMLKQFILAASDKTGGRNRLGYRAQWPSDPRVSVWRTFSETGGSFLLFLLHPG